MVLGPGEIVIVLKGVWHRPSAAEEVRNVLIEPKATAQTGSIQSKMSVAMEDQIRI
ncbi:MAG: hypothetical protein WKF80_10525 [Thermomicrobiales bacterium]